MKRAIFAIACVVVLGVSLMSCNKDEEQCWNYSYIMATGESYEGYMWTTQNKMDAQKELWEKYGYTKIKCYIDNKYKTIEDCVAQNVQ